MTFPQPASPQSASSSLIWSSHSPSPQSSPQISALSASHSQTSAPAFADPTSFTIPQSIEGSEQPLIARTHYTNGYRAGISAGKDDPEIAQKGFDAGFPLGAALAMRVGYLLEAVKELVRCLEAKEESRIAEAVQGVPALLAGQDRDQSSMASVSYALSFAEAQRDLDLTTLLREMETLGLLENTENAELQPRVAPEGSRKAQEFSSSAHFVDRLPSVVKWTQLVQQAGKAANPG